MTDSFTLPDEPAERLREMVTRVVEALDLDATVTVTETDDELRANVDGDDLGLLIGKHGATIDALQHLAVRVALRAAPPRQACRDRRGGLPRAARGSAAAQRRPCRQRGAALRPAGGARADAPARAQGRPPLPPRPHRHRDPQRGRRAGAPPRRHAGPAHALSVSRETVAALSARYGLPDSAADRLLALLSALAAEPDPPTTVADPAEALDRHLADSLSGLEVPALRQATRIADIGAGAGFPGLPLAIALPDAHVDLIESTRRKCDVIARLATAANIPNVQVIPTRAEEWATTDAASSYDTVTARALASLPILAEYAAPLLNLGGHLIAWKASVDPAEQQAGTAAAAILGLEPVEVLPVTPFPRARNRTLHVYRKVADTPPRFPRRPGMAAKRPLAK